MPPTGTNKETESPTQKGVHAYWNHSRFSQSRESKTEEMKATSQSYLKHLMYLPPPSNPYFPVSFTEQIAARFCISIDFINAYAGAYGGVRNVPAGTEVSGPSANKSGYMHFCLMGSNANAFERQGSLLPLNGCIGGISICSLCQCEIKHCAAVTQKESCSMTALSWV